MKLLRYVAPTLMTATVTFGLIAGPQAAADPEFPYPPCEPESVWKQMPPRCDEPSFGPAGSDVPDVPDGPDGPAGPGDGGDRGGPGGPGGPGAPSP